MSVREMDEYVCQLSPDPMELESQIANNDTTNDIMDVQLVTQTSPTLLLASASAKVSSVTSPPTIGTSNLPTQKNTCSASPRTSVDALPTKSTEHSVDFLMDRSPQTLAPHSPSTRAEVVVTSVHSPYKQIIPSSLQQATHRPGKKVHRALASTQHASDASSFESVLSNSEKTPQSSPSMSGAARTRYAHISPKEKNILRVEARWAPKDFSTLKTSKALMYTRFAPILSSFNTTHSWVVEWQTDQLAKAPQIELTQMDQFMSIRCVASPKQKCFYFSFRLQASGAQFIQVLKSNALQSIKRGERISFDPSFIPPTHGEVTQIGDILLKDATSTHRGHYLAYLRSEVLPKDTPPFDLKIRHKDPSGVKSQVAQTLSSVLNGEGTNPEIFISRLALGTNRITRGDHERIYQIHHDFMADIIHLPFQSSKQIDIPIVEYLDTGEQISRTPRQWAKSLGNSEGTLFEVGLENGLPHGDAVLIVPSAYAEQASVELNKYWQRQNPMLMNAERFFSASVLADPHIPLTVFTKNIDTILAKKIKKKSLSLSLNLCSLLLHHSLAKRPERLRHQSLGRYHYNNQMSPISPTPTK